MNDGTGYGKSTMKTAKDFPVTFGYGETSYPYSEEHKHLGEDRKMPLNTPVTVNETLIGLAGTTGFSTGVHTHTQKVANGAVQHPRGGGFDVPYPAVVTETGYSKSIGNYVRYKDAKGVVWSIFHLNKITVKKGDILGMSDKEIKSMAASHIRFQIGATASSRELNKYVRIFRESGWYACDKWIKGWARYKANLVKAKTAKLIAKNHLPYTIRKDYKEPPQDTYEKVNETLYRRK